MASTLYKERGEGGVDRFQGQEGIEATKDLSLACTAIGSTMAIILMHVVSIQYDARTFVAALHLAFVQSAISCAFCQSGIVLEL